MLLPGKLELLYPDVCVRKTLTLADTGAEVEPVECLDTSNGNENSENYVLPLLDKV